MSTNLRRIDFCGGAEIANLSHSKDPREAILQLLPEMTHRTFNRPQFIIYTGVVEVRGKEGAAHARTGRRDNYGQDFTEYLLNNRLGEVLQSDPRVNNNSGNLTRMWVWQPDYPALHRWWDLNQPPRKFGQK